MATILGQEGPNGLVQIQSDRDPTRTFFLPPDQAQQMVLDESPVPEVPLPGGTEVQPPSVPGVDPSFVEQPPAPPQAFVPGAFGVQQPPEQPSISPGPAPIPPEQPAPTAPPGVEAFDQEIAALDAQPLANRSGSIAVSQSRSRQGGGMAQFPTAPDTSGAMDEIARATRLQEEAARIEADAATEAGNIEYDRQIEKAQHQREAATDAAVAHARARSTHKEWEAKVEESMRAIPQADPGRVFTNAGTFGTIGHIFSAAISGFLNPGGPNSAIEMASKLIDQDMRAQQIDIETAREKVYRTENAMERAERWTDKVNAGEAERRAYLWGAVEADLSARAAGLASPIAKANYFKQVSQVRLKKTESLLQAGQQNFSNELAVATEKQRALNAQREHQAAMARIGLGNRELAQRAKEFDASQKPKPGDVAILADASTGAEIQFDSRVALSKERVSEISENQTIRRDLGNKVKQYKDLVAKIGRKYQGAGSDTRFTDGEASLLQSAFMDVASTLTKERTGASMTEQERAQYQEMLGKPPGRLGADPTKKLERFLGTLAQKERDEFRTLRASQDGKPYDPGAWYLESEAPRAASAPGMGDLITVARTDSSPKEVNAAVQGINSILEIPRGKQDLLDQNPHAVEELESRLLMAASDAKANGDLPLAKEILQTREQFLKATLVPPKSTGPAPMDYEPGFVGREDRRPY